MKNMHGHMHGQVGNFKRKMEVIEIQENKNMGGHEAMGSTSARGKRRRKRKEGQKRRRAQQTMEEGVSASKSPPGHFAHETFRHPGYKATVFPYVCPQPKDPV